MRHTCRSDTLEAQTNESNSFSAQCDCDIRDLTKKISSLESAFDETSEKLLVSQNRLAELEMDLHIQEEDVSALSRRISLLEVSMY